jgi:hypothetical protein
MRVNQGFLGWGVFFILVGAIPLAVNSGYLPADQVDDWWSYWPLILVGIGIGIILSRTVLNWLGGLIVAATFGLMVGSLVATGVGGIPLSGCGGGDTAGIAFPSRSGQFTGAADVELDFNCGELTVTTVAGSGWSLEGSDDTGAGPDLVSSDTSLRIETRDPTGFPLSRAPDRWQLTLPQAVEIDLRTRLNAGSGDIALGGADLGAVDVEMNAGSIRLDMTGATASSLDVGINAGSIGITLPASSLAGSIEANAGSVEICTPPDVGLRIETGESLTASYDYDGQGLTQSGDTWTSAGYESASVKLDLKTQGNAASFSLNPEDGCNG